MIRLEAIWNCSFLLGAFRSLATIIIILGGDHMATDKRQFTLRMQEDNFLKIKKISNQQKRSIAMQIEYIVSEYIKNFEHENGIVEVSPED
jgi:hypothetical protein